MKMYLIFAFFCLIGFQNAFAQYELETDIGPPDDSGWIYLFDGTSLDNFISYLGTNLTDLPNETFKIVDDYIRSSGSPTGHIIHRQNFSRYTLRMQMRHESGGGNAGMLYHIHEEGMWLGSYPRSMEYQGNSNGAGEVWTIGNVWIKTRVEDPDARPRTYKEDGIMVDHGNPQGRRCKGSSNPYQLGQDWNEFEIRVWGEDSSHHEVNGETIFKAWLMRWSDADDPNDYDNMLSWGRIGWQSEGVPVHYRNIRIKLREDDPLYDELYPKVGCMDTSYAEYDNTAEKHDSTLCVTKIGCMDQNYEEYDSTAVQNDSSLCLTLDVGREHYTPVPYITFGDREVSVKHPGHYLLEIHNIQNKILERVEGRGSMVYSCDGLRPGIYFVQVITETGVYGTRILLF